MPIERMSSPHRLARAIFVAVPLPFLAAPAPRRVLESRTSRSRRRAAMTGGDGSPRLLARRVRLRRLLVLEVGRHGLGQASSTNVAPSSPRPRPAGRSRGLSSQLDVTRSRELTGTARPASRDLDHLLQAARWSKRRSVSGSPPTAARRPPSAASLAGALGLGLDQVDARPGHLVQVGRDQLEGPLAGVDRADGLRAGATGARPTRRGPAHRRRRGTRGAPRRRAAASRAAMQRRHPPVCRPAPREQVPQARTTTRSSAPRPRSSRWPMRRGRPSRLPGRCRPTGSASGRARRRAAPRA